VGDRLGRLALSTQALAERDRRVFAACHERGVAVAVSMAGGYGRDVEDTVSVHLNTLRAAESAWRACSLRHDPCIA
jgi:acetoin utilization deacetylase AcuC-like enzyme